MSKHKKDASFSAAPFYGTAVGLHTDKNTKTGFLIPLLKVIIAAVGAGGAVLCYFPVIMPHAELPPVFLISAAVCIMCGAALYIGKWGNALIGGIYFALAAAVYKLHKELYIGYIAVFNEFYSETHMKGYAGVEFYDLSAYNEEEIESGVYLAVAFFTVAVALLEGTFIVYRTAVVPAFLATFFPLEMTLYFGLVPNYFCAAAVVCSWTAAAAAEAAELPVSGRDRRRAAYYSVSGQSAAVIAAVTAFCLSAAGAGVYYSGFERPDSMIRFRKDFSQYFRTFSWDKFKNDLSAMNPVNPDISGATNHGRLGRTDEITFTEETMLNVTLPKRYDNVYIRGFIGSDYTGNSWTECWENEELSARLSEVTSGFGTEGLQPLFIDGYTLEEFGEGYSEESIFIEKKGANSNTVYFPYFIMPESSEGITVNSDKPEAENDFPVDVFGISTARQRVYIERNPFEYSYSNSALYNDEKRYREFVYEEYLDIPSAFTAAKAIYGDSEFTSLPNELYSIKKWLEDNCSYDLSAGRLPFGKDFAQYFLTENRKGSCSHFATAAALMCRYRGIPSRYVEGYVIKPEDFPENGQKGDNVTVELTDERAHAWIEVYLDGYGWMPYETTPGYSSDFITDPGLSFTGNSSGIYTEEIFAEEITATETATETTAADDIWETEISETAAEGTETESISSADKSGEETEDSSPESTGGSLAPIIAAAAVLLIPAVIAAVRYKNVTGARNRLLTGKNSRKKARAAGKYFMELCGYKNIKKDKDMSAAEFGEYAERSIAELKKGSAEIILNAALEAEYAEEYPSDEAADSAAAAVVRFAGELCEDMNSAERFVFKYIRCLK